MTWQSTIPHDFDARPAAGHRFILEIGQFKARITVEDSGILNFYSNPDYADQQASRTLSIWLMATLRQIRQMCEPADPPKA
jgi:hypothetical protein